ncbi:hypothetical protein DRE_00498 [Drechslerella stenobrocha 248]|uniref:ATP-dependent helicase HRQ1 n=1 Tax=Drechslerella stenobrocha 248 TaxID=1043628 RepID=W7IEU9_9PEZI|nr:hypothetical protein DRE_00498 [Drechslerella stenobrocha 248]
MSADAPSINRKRKRTKATGPLNIQPSQSRVTPGPGLAQEPDPQPVVGADWPAHFIDLAATHRALNLTYTFFCTRKQFATTFDNLASAADGDNNLPNLRPELDAPDLYLLPEPRRNPKQVLLFEFTDDDLRPMPKSRQSLQYRRRRLEDVTGAKIPEFSHTELLRVISNRNDRFKRAIHKLLEVCRTRSLDPVEYIKLQQRTFEPTKTTTDGNTGSPDNKPSDNAPTAPLAIPKSRNSIQNIVQEITQCPEIYKGQIASGGILRFPEQEPKYGTLHFALSQNLVDALFNVKNITRLYSHQASALNDIFNGDHVVVSTSTSSGKSIIYQIPFLHKIEHDPSCRAMLIFPTKALAQDQKTSLTKMIDFMNDSLGPVLVETYDGDTSFEHRGHIRAEARVILTNPDMLHANILPHEEQWRTFLKNLKFVVLDELHVYNGLFGSHVAFIIRRLRRICSAVGNNNITFIACSATVANPIQHMKDLTGLSEVKLTSTDGSPAGEKTFLCWNCPYKDPSDIKSGRTNPIQETAQLFVELMLRGVRTIAFCRVRQTCELTLGAIKQLLIHKGLSDITDKVMSYRGGYSAQDRRRIEREMFNGHLMGIVATTALELGVDIGALDAVIMVGFPYSISNLRQQSGRAGRRKRDSLSILIGDRFPLDQHYMSNPELIASMPNPSLHIDLENILVLEGHIQCAAFEMPINPKQDETYFGSSLKKLAEERLLKDGNDFYHCNERFRPYPSQHVAIRETENDHFVVVDVTQNRNVILEQVEASRAVFSLYEGAIFLHQGFKYLVRELNADRRIAKVELVQVDWTTRQRDFTDIDPIATEATRRLDNSPFNAYFGIVKKTSVVFGYFKIDRKGRILDACDVETPPVEMLSKGMWLDVPKAAFEILKSKKLHIAAAIHAAEHALLSLLPNFVVSSPSDVRTECKAPQKEFARKESKRKRPGRLMFYDSKGGSGGTGPGITLKAFEFIDQLLRMALGRVEACVCQNGCPECIASTTCSEANAVLSKVGSLVILKTLLNEHIDIDNLPEGPEDAAPAGIDTVIIA